MKFNTKCVKNMYGVFTLVIVLVASAACNRESAYSRLLTQEYPGLYEQVFARNADSLLSYTSHDNEFIRRQAWRALISTPADGEVMDEFITKVQYDNSLEAWTALSAQELSDEQLGRLHDLWESRESLRGKISLVLGQQGNQQSLDFLVNNFEDIIDSNHEYQSALAISRLMLNYEIKESSLQTLLKYAAVIEDDKLFRAYYYGLYRSNRSVESEELKKAIWETYGWVDNPKIRQYVLRISFNNDAEDTFQKLPVGDVVEMNVPLAVELARQTGKVGWSEKLESVFEKLLEHSNPVVNETALSQIINHPEKNDVLDEVIIAKIVENEEKNPSVRLSGIEALGEPSGYLDLAESLAEGNEYLLIKKLNIYQNVVDEDDFLQKLEEFSGSPNRMEVLFAARALAGWWNGLDEVDKTSSEKQRVRRLVFDLLEKGDRSITYVLVPFIQSSGLIASNDYGQIMEFLSLYKLPEDVEVYQVFGDFLKELFESRAKPLIDSLAAYGNSALNNTFIDQGWDITATETSTQKFRKPGWKRLGELGNEPTWVLETEKGVIKITIDALSAPATISGIDSLTKAGVYDGVVFHRVVPNFVIQGGDVETGDGFGGPDYVVPTEASEKEYRRGMVGIASAGTDTEGSQYFIMHQWAPHLDGRYTIIGEVAEGMEVVDRILVGDKVIKAYWQQN